MGTFLKTFLLLISAAAVAFFLLSGFSTVTAASFANDADPKRYQLSEGKDGDRNILTGANFDSESIAIFNARRLASFKGRSLRSPYSYPSPQKAPQDHQHG